MTEDATGGLGWRMRRHMTAISVVVLALLAYLPALTAAPGRMPADSKLYVYLNPGRFLGDAATTFDPRQFAGWVPHQHISYLWPTGPWFWVFDTIGSPDWIAHRLWIGTLLVVAGLGVRWMTRVLGFGPLAALVAALVYQLSPYALPYISRTSVLLLPYAGLGWIVGLTVLASLRGGWRYPAGVALVVFSVGAVNATALAMVIPAPVLWLLHAAWGRTITWTRAASTAARTALLCSGVSIWWIVMLLIQGRRGADVLAYSESLGSVSFTSTSTEVARGLGYWLFYVRDASGATTTAALDHLVSGRTILAGYVVIAIGLVGLVLVRWQHRRFAGLLFGVGVILGVGVHPIEDPSPLMSLLVGDGEGGLALALRSSTRAVPVLLLGLALGTAAVVARVGQADVARRLSQLVPRRLDVQRRLPRSTPAILLAAFIGLSAIVALPALRNGGFVDPTLERDQAPPDSWTAAAADLDARPDGYRVLQVPGTEFGAFQWGYTVDQPLPALTERPLVTRDLLPLGSPAAMDLLFALDDRIQTDTIETDAVAAVSRLLGVDTVWVTGDVAYDRFQLARPEVVIDELSRFDGTTYGEPTVMEAAIPMIDNRSLGDPRIGQPIPPVALLDVPDPIPTVRVKDRTVVIAGSGDGIVDAAAAGVIDGSEAILYAATLQSNGPSDQVASAAVVEQPFGYVLTDSNRDRAHHWRSSQDVTGFTESAAEDSDLLRAESADQRLPIFTSTSGGARSADHQTVSVQEGPVTARASGYGERFAYRPEHRPAMAIDGDPSTAWIVADRAPAVGEFLELTANGPVDHLDLLQPAVGAGERSITEVGIVVDDGDPLIVALDGSSMTAPGQRVEIPVTSGPSTITITINATTTPQPPVGPAIGGVGFVDIETGLGPTTEFIRTPTAGVDAMADADFVDVVLTRLRVEPTDRWRSDPEPQLRRIFELGADLAFDTQVTVRLDRRLDDDALAVVLGEPAVATSHLTGAVATRGAAAFDDDASTAWTTPFDRAVGESVLLSGDGDATEMTIAQPGGDHSPITALRVTDPGGTFDLELAPAADAVIDLPRPVDLSEIRLEIVAVDERFVQNRRFNEPTLLPAAISEVRFDGRSPAVAPTDRLVIECTDEFLSIDGDPVPVRFDVDTTAALRGQPIAAESCGDAIELASGTHRLSGSSSNGFNVDRAVLRSTERGAAAVARDATTIDPGDPVVVASSARSRTVEVPACPSGCWLILGEGFSDGWEASAGGGVLDGPVLVDGNANGWWIEPTDDPTRVRIDWTVQRVLNMAYVLTAIAIAACVVIIIRTRRRSDARGLITSLGRPLAVDYRANPPSGRSMAVAGGVVALGAAVFIDWTWVVPTAVVWLGAALLKRPQLVGVVGAAIVIGTGLIVTYLVRFDSPFPDAGWPIRFEWLHPWTLFGVVLITGSALVRSAPLMPQRSSTNDNDTGTSPST